MPIKDVIKTSLVFFGICKQILPKIFLSKIESCIYKLPLAVLQNYF